jgi:uncharacterized circularly permuted ATP-grasp superfamily protein
MTGTGLVSAGAAKASVGPETSPLVRYVAPESGNDIFASATPPVAAKWHTFAAGLAQQAQGDPGSLQSWLDRHVEDLGLGYRLAGDDQERAWPLSPMPILIGADEWAGIERGLIQRARLLEAVIADIYGPQKLVTQGHLPAALISGSEHFARRMMGVRPPGGRYLHVCAMDLALSPNGGWRVLADRVRLPVGIGYALQNRLAVSRATGGLLASIGTRRETDFFDALRSGIAAHCQRADPRIGLLTPGRFNQSYPEQAHLARYLGFSLVEGRDLVVRDDRLFVRTIAGLKRIDALWRWINTRDIDPMNFDTRSQIGVPNLIEAASDGLVVANWPGVGVVESRAMPAFLPRLAQTLLGEQLTLPNVATWWCGGEPERGHVLANLEGLVVSSAFRQPVAGLLDGRTRLGSGLSVAEQADLADAMRRRPMDYTAQELVGTATTPAFVSGQFEPRGFVLRAFVARDEGGDWHVMPGGFARLSQGADLRTPLMSLGDVSADVCIVEDGPSDRQVSPPRNEAPGDPTREGLAAQPGRRQFLLARALCRTRRPDRADRTRSCRASIDRWRAGGGRIRSEQASWPAARNGRGAGAKHCMATIATGGRGTDRSAAARIG